MVTVVIIYGIKNCDTVRKARAWIEQRNMTYQFHDYRVDGITAPLLSEFAEQLGWETLLNKRSSTWRQLPDAQKSDLNADTTLQLLLEHPTLIKRPIVKTAEVLMVGFNADEYQAKL
jgi:Spx/MgsR family transcriptional regulator